MVSDRREADAAPLASLLDLSGRTAVVTGGAAGIGLAIAGRLAEAGATVLIADIDVAAARASAEDLAARHSADVRATVLNVRVAADVERVAEEAVALGRGLSVWVNNAGVYPASPIAEMSDQLWRGLEQTTLTGTVWGCRAAARRMLAAPDAPGRVIVNISSIAGIRGRAGMAGYTAVKHAVVGLVRSLAVELGPSGIRVIGVAPSLVETPGIRARRSDADSALVDFEARTVSAVPLGRMADADDVARVVLFGVTDAAAFLTGSVIPVDGGLSAA